MAHRTLLVAALIGANAALAQAPAPPLARQPGETLADMAARRFPQPVQVGSLLNRTVLAASESRNVVGRVLGVVRQDGQVKIIVAYGGLLGLGSRRIAVPIEGMVLILHSMEIVGLTPDQLPSYEEAGAIPLSPQEVVKVGLARPTH